jgi:hypothetical protein
MRPLDILNCPNRFSRNTAQGWTQALTEMVTKRYLGGKGRPARKADNLTAICVPIVYTVWEPLRLTALLSTLFMLQTDR